MVRGVPSIYTWAYILLAAMITFIAVLIKKLQEWLKEKREVRKK